MGVFSTNRVLTEGYDTIKTPEPDMSYCGADAANRILTEMVREDQAFFESIIRNDIEQAFIENAMSKGETDLEDKLYALQEATATGIFGKIKEFFVWLWKKIKGFFVGIYNKIKKVITPDNKKLIEKYKAKIDNKSAGDYKQMKFKWCDVKGKDGKLTYQIPIDPETNSFSSEKDKLYKYCEDKEELTYYAANNQTGKDFVAAVEALNTRVNDTETFYFNTYSSYITSHWAPKNPSDLANACHKYFFAEETEKVGDFEKYKADILNCLTNSDALIDDITKSEKTLDSYFKKEIAECDKINSVYNSLSKDSTFKTQSATKHMNGNDILTKQRTADELTKDGENGSVATTIAKAANAIKNYTTKLQTCIIGLLNQQVAAIQFHTKQCRRVWTQAGSFSGKSEDTILFDAIGEAADFDTDQLFAAYED